MKLALFAVLREKEGSLRPHKSKNPGSLYEKRGMCLRFFIVPSFLYFKESPWKNINYDKTYRGRFVKYLMTTLRFRR